MKRIATLVVALAAAWPAAAAQAQAPDVEGTLRGCDPLDEFACMLPFPNDFFTKRDASTATGRRLSLPIQGMPRNAAGKPVDPTDINRGDGFSPGSMIVTKVPGLDSVEAMSATGAVPITDMARYADPDQPIVVIDAETGERHPIWAEIDSNPADPANRTLIVRPARNFEEGRRYIVALRNLKDAQGNPIEQTGTFRKWRDEPPNERNPGKGRRAHFETIFDTLDKKANIDRQSLYLAWDFTVASAQSIAGRMLHIRDESFAMLGDEDLADRVVEGDSPQFTVATVTENPQNHPTVARRITGTVRVPCWLSGGLDCGPGNRFAIGSDGMPVRAHDGYYSAPFRCDIPRSAVEGPGVRRVRPSLYGHGLFGSLGEMDQGQLRRLADEHGFMFCATDWKGMSSEDVVPTLATVVPDLSNFPQLADRVQQGMLNFLYLGRAMLHPGGFSAHPAFQDDGEAVIDTTRLYYDGNSQGGIIGPALTAVAPDYDRAVHGVPGMNYSTLLQRSTDFVGAPLEDWAATVAVEAPQRLQEAVSRRSPDPIRRGSSFSTFIYAAYPDETTRQLMFATLQLLWDRSEANGYAHHLTTDPLPNTPPHEILLHVGHGDHQVADLTAEVMARTAGMRVLRSDMLRPGRHTSVEPFWGIPEIETFPYAGSALVSWDIGPWRPVGNGCCGTPPSPTTNTAPSRQYQDPHEFPRRQPAARRQKDAFLAPGGQVIDACDGSYCDADPTL